MNGHRKTAGTTYRIRPLAAAIQALIAGGLALGGTGPSRADSPLPVPTNINALATAGDATARVDGNAMTINQATPRATLDWQSFNIDKGYSVEFRQPSSTSVALNNIRQQDASKILGALTANGQVYLVNQNGFLFGRDSQINVNALVASTLNISQADFDAGITKVFDLNKNRNDFSTSAAALKGNGEVYLRNAQGQPVLDQEGNRVKIQIYLEQGASIKTRGEGGRVILAAPSITNAGTIETPDGQTILAASSDRVYLQEVSDDPDLRGLLVEVGTGGDVNNVGKIIAERGNASLVGFAVNQQGIVSATTSVRLNGSVRLLAREGIQTPVSVSGQLVGRSTLRARALEDGLGTRAEVNLASGSQTRVDLDADKTLTAIDAQAQSPSKIEISGHRVTLRGGSTVVANSGEISIKALDNPANPVLKGDARIFLESGATVDASGVENVALSANRNVVEVELRKNELRDAPLQRNGVLFTEKVKVDLRDANLTHDDEGNLISATIPVADIKGAVDRIARNIDERSTAGGQITLQSSGDVIARAGSTLNVSGGSVAYQGGHIETTQVRSGSLIFDIADAHPDRFYDSLFNTTRFSAGYVEGKAGGQLRISAYEAVLDGNLQGRTVNGQLQRLPNQWAPAASLILDLVNGNTLGKQDVVLTHLPELRALGPNDRLPRKNSGSPEPLALILNTQNLRLGGFRDITVSTNGKVSLTEGARLDLPVGGRLALSGRDFDIFGSIVAPSGHVSLKPVQIDAILTPSAIILGSSALIDVSGWFINDAVDLRSTRTLNPLPIHGGSVSLRTEQRDLSLAPGSRILADGGAWMPVIQPVEAGTGGQISLVATRAVAGTPVANLRLNGTLSARGLRENGRLTLESNEIVMGRASDAPTRIGAATPLILTPEFFADGGFSDYRLTSNLNGITVANNLKLDLRQRNYQLTAQAATAPTGRSLGSVSRVTTLPSFQINPVHLALSFIERTERKTNERVSIGEGASLSTDVGGSIALNSTTAIAVNGTLNTPGGRIALTIDNPPLPVGFFNEQSIWLGANSRLLAQGAFVRQPSTTGLMLGQVWDGGSVSLTANRGYIVSQSGSRIDVSGSSQQLDIQRWIDGRPRLLRLPVASAGGHIALTTGEGMLIDGQMNAASGGGTAAGGRLSVSLQRGLRDKPEFPVPGQLFPDDGGANANRAYRIEISDSASTQVPGNLQAGSRIDPALFGGRALVNARTLNAAGLDTLHLNTDSVRVGVTGELNSGVWFNGDVALRSGREIVLDTPRIRSDGGNVNLTSGYVSLGSTSSRQGRELAPSATGGLGRFSVDAQALELVGGLAFAGIGTVNLNSTGDARVRGVLNAVTKDYLGELRVAGNLTLRAAQLYPATLTDYTINLTGNHTATFLNANPVATTPVLSAGGKLTVNAANIHQRGNLKAPFGSLTLNAAQTLQLEAGSLTSVAGNGAIVPFGRVSGGVDWLYPLNDAQTTNIVVSTPPEKSLQLIGAQVNLNEGARIDLSGGGDLYAYEFVPGPGGSRDVLGPGSGSFAVLPGFSNPLTPFDPLETQGAGVAVGDSVYLHGGGGLAAGWYTLLPARYALLPGAFLLTPKADTQDQARNVTLLSGSTLVVGQRGAVVNGSKESRTQGFVVEPGSLARTRSEYFEFGANAFFANKAQTEGSAAPQLPRDAGRLMLSAQTRLNLAAQLIAAPAGNGLGGQVDITGNRLAVVAHRNDLNNLASGVIGLVADDLNRFDAPSLLLGGKRSKDAQGQRIKVSASGVVVGSGAHLIGEDIVLAATDTLDIAANATIESIGSSGKPGETLWIDNEGGGSDGALLRVSSFGQSDIKRSGLVSGTRGELRVAAGARVKADSAILLDATRNTVFDGVIDMNGGSLALNASRISIGAVPTATPGLVLGNTNASFDELRLISRGDFDIYGGVDFSANRLLISAANINGFANAGQTAVIDADFVELSNPGVSSARNGNGQGTLRFDVREMRLGSGNFGIHGFNNVTFNVAETLAGSGRIVDASSGNGELAAAGVLRVAGNLTIDAGYWSGGSGSTTRIDATGYQVNLAATAPLPGQTTVGLGASWSVIADAITGSGRFLLPSGRLHLQALQGDVSLTDGTVIDLAGRTVTFDDVIKASPAGELALLARQGGVSLASGAQVDLRSARLGSLGLADAGRLTVAAQTGFNWLGRIDAHAGDTQVQGLHKADFALDAGSLGDVTALIGQLDQAGFAGDVSLRQRNGDIALLANDHLRARSIDLAADAGSVSIAGTLDASAVDAGRVAVYGRNGITLASSGRLLANATSTAAAGGEVTLDTVHRDGAGSGRLDLSASGGLIDVSGGSGGEGGRLHLRTGRDTSHQVNISGIAASIRGVAPDQGLIEATRVYSGQSTINATQIAAWQTDTAQFMSNRPTPVNTSGAVLNLLPGIEIRSNGDLTLATAWDFMQGQWSVDQKAWDSNWRYLDSTGRERLPGVLTLRAAGNLHINASLSDAVATTPVSGQWLLDDPENPVFAEDFLSRNLIQPGLSWHFNLHAGNDIRLAAQNAGESVAVRTGTGNIALQAGRDLTFLTAPGQPRASAAVYTLGTTASYTRSQLLNGEIPGLPAQQNGESLSAYLGRLGSAQLDAVLRYGLLDEGSIALGSELFAEFPIHGGNLSITAGRHIDGVQTGQSISDWLVRAGGSNTPTAWGINISGDRILDTAVEDNGRLVLPSAHRQFNQSVGALGGGNVSIDAGGTIRNLSAMLPTTGKPLGQLNDSHEWIVRETVVNGGGDLSIRAGGDIVGGEYYVGQGSGRLVAGGSITQGNIGGSTQRAGALLNLGDARFDLIARQDVRLAAALSPTLLAQTRPGNPSVNVDTRFFTYTTDSAVNLLSVAGNVVLENDYQAIKSLKSISGTAGSGFEYFVYPGRLRGVALSGDVRLNESFTLMPSARGELQLLAADNIGSDTRPGLAQTLRFNMSDTDPAFLPGIVNPAISLEGSFISGVLLTRELLDPESPRPATIHAVNPVHAANPAIPLIMAKHGDINFAAGLETTFFMPQAARFSAGRDIVNLSVSGQNLAADDVTRLTAGRDIRFDTVLDDNGNVVLTRNNPQFLRLAGPGQLDIVAGRHISLGTAGGIESVGNLLNAALSRQGASLNVLAGIAGNPDLAGFIDHYRGQYPNELAGLVGLGSGELRQHLGTVMTVFFRELADAAKLAAAAPEGERKALYQRGFDAVARLFPGEAYQGDISLVFSSIKTLAGGDINLVVPGGKLDVGLTGKKAAGELGIVVQQAGNLNAFTQGNINVNQSRVFTLGGGDIMAWSAKGDIDAGRGAKSALSAPKPITTIDANGNIVTQFPPVISGSGIQAIGGGDVTLAAPEGVVDAGEAGIYGGNITIAATAVIGAANIQATGSAVGVPTAVATPSMPTGVVGAAASAARQADQDNNQGAGSNGEDDKNRRNSSAVAIITSDVVGFGQCSVSDVREGKAGCS